MAATSWVPACLLAYDADIGQQALYDVLYESASSVTGGDRRMIYVLFLALAHSLPTVGINGAHWLVKKVLGEGVLEHYRWQAGRQPPAALVRKCIRYVAILHVIAPILPYALYPRAIHYHPTMFTAPVPGILSLLVQFFVAFLFTDFLFYWTHRLLHTVPFLYRTIHKQHHQFYVSIGLAAEYAHPELICGNIMPVFFAGVVFQYHIFALASWVLIAMAGTTFHHSGFKPPVAPSDDFHDFHHSHVVCNFGSSPFWDWVCGTSQQWQAQQSRVSNIVTATYKVDPIPPLSTGASAVVAVPRRGAARSSSPATRRKRSTSARRK